MLKGASSETSKQTRQRHARMSQRFFCSERMVVKSMMLNDIDMHNEEIIMSVSSQGCRIDDDRPDHRT